MPSMHRKDAHLAFDFVGLSAQFLDLPVVVPPFDRHLLVLTLQPFDSLLAREALIFYVSLGTLELLLSVRELLMHPLSQNNCVNIIVKGRESGQDHERHAARRAPRALPSFGRECL